MRAGIMIARRRVQRSLLLSGLLLLAALSLAVAGAIGRPGTARAQDFSTEVIFSSCPTYTQVLYEIENFSGFTKTITFGPEATNCYIKPIRVARLSANSNLVIKGNGLTWSADLPAQTENVIEVAPNSSLTLDGVTIKWAKFAIQAIGATQVTVINSTITGSDTGIQAFSADNVTVINSNINGNDKGIVAGDAIVAYSSVSNNALTGLNAVNATVVNSTISGNGGDGIYTDDVSVTFSTISGNGSRGINASVGDGPGPTGSVDIVASILANNAGPNCTGIATLYEHGYNLSDDASCSFFSITSAINATDLHLNTYGDYSSPTFTIPLLLGSSALDAIQVDGNNHCLNAAGNPITDPFSGAPLTIDQLDQDRPFGAGCDVGALEVSRFNSVISWDPSPATFTYGAALGSGQLNATASVAGSFTYAYSGTTAGGDTISSAATSGAILPAGSYTLTANFTPDDTAGYYGATATTTLTVNPATLTISAQDASMTYGASALPSFTVGYSGFVNEDTTGELTGNLACVAADGNGQVIAASSPPGAYTIDCSSSTLSAPNYAIAYQSGALTIGKAPLTVTADDLNRAYGAANPPFTASYDGFVNGDDASALGGSLTFTTSPTAATGVGEYTVTPGGLTSPNYTITFQAGLLHISPAPLSVVADNASRAYGAANPPFTGALTGVVNGDNITASYGTTAATGSPVGAYAIVPVLADPDGKLVNYTVVSANGALTVTRAPLTVTADDQSRGFGMPNPSLTVSYSGFVNGETLATSGVTGSPACDTTAHQSSPAGSYPITCTQGTLNAANYTWTVVPGELTVTYTGGPCLTGRHAGPLTIEAGQSICLGAGFRQTGPTKVLAGGALYIDGATLTGPVRANGASAVRMCGARLTGPLTLSGTTGPVVVGDEDGTPACAGNTITGPVRLDGNQGGVVFNDNTVIGLVVISNTTGTNQPPNASPVDYTGNTVIGPERILP